MKNHPSNTFRQRNPERQRLHHALYNARKRGSSPGKLASLEKQLEENKLAVCPKCQDSYTSHSKQGECMGIVKE